MTREGRRGDVEATITGNINGQVAIGHGNRQVATAAAPEGRTTRQELLELAALFVKIRQELTGLPKEVAQQAHYHLNELEEAVTTTKPDLNTMEYVRNWFARKLPRLAAAVTGIVVHPIMTKIVAAAGDTVAADFRERFREFL
jgi:hypothetical protein